MRDAADTDYEIEAVAPDAAISPCPFCGAAKVDVVVGVMACKGCGGPMSSCICTTCTANGPLVCGEAEEAIEAWCMRKRGLHS